jgi:hypothetical protein
MTKEELREYHKEYNKKWYAENKEKRGEQLKKYREENKEKIKEFHKNNNDKRRKKYAENREENLIKRRKYLEANKEKIAKQRKEYNLKNKEKNDTYRYDYIKNRLKNDKIFKFRLNISNLIRQSFNNGSYTKKSKLQEILGCTYEEFVTYIESRFEDWMNWENHGKYNGDFNYGWDIDHIIPISTAQTIEDVIKLNHYTNLQPLCSKVNRNIKRGNL